MGAYLSVEPCLFLEYSAPSNAQYIYGSRFVHTAQSMYSLKLIEYPSSKAASSFRAIRNTNFVEKVNGNISHSFGRDFAGKMSNHHVSVSLCFDRAYRLISVLFSAPHISHRLISSSILTPFFRHGIENIYF